ncbi:MAG: M6 family metalloprotease domain-containing protein [Paludibacteraceae bacterium]|nr:M6 family metalloprotease domain-containing protein [Paludibacteraceae bacterium]
MKKIVTMMLLCGLSLAAYAVPAKRGWQTRTQADGTTIEVQQFGDEFYHYMLNRDGKQVREVNGMFEVVGEAPAPEVAKARHAAAKAKRTRKATNAEFGYTPYLPPKGVVIMVNYSDKSFKTTTTKAIIDELCNSTNCTVNSYNGVNYGSIGQYFRDQSDGQYNLQLDVYGPVTLDNNYAYYGQDYQQEGNDRYSGNVIIEACSKMNSEIDFSQYDWNNDGEVDFVYVVYAGKGQADGGDANTIWPHSWDIESSRSYGSCTYSAAQCKFDGKAINHYAMSNELSGSSLAGIGIICHEYGHVIGLPDHYDTDYSTNYNDELTPNEWDVMDGGSYNGDIHCPPNYNAWEKAFCGWYTPQNLGNEGQNLTIKSIGTNGWSAYQINASGTQQAVTTNNSTNYYIENRQQQGWDTFIPYHGLLIWKVNYIKSYWTDNEPNLTSHGDPHFTLVCSSGTKVGSSNGTGNVFPKGSIKSWTGVSGKPLLNIAESNGVVTLTYIEEPSTPVDPFNLTFMANGREFATTTSTGTVVLPANNPLDCPCGKVFLGWTKTAGYESETTAPTYVKAGEPIEEATTLYAVYAEQSGEGGEPQSTTYTFTSKAWADATNSWNSVKDGYAIQSNQGVQVTANYSGAAAETKTAQSGVSKVVVNYCTNATKGAGSIAVSVGETELSKDVIKTGGTSLRELEYTFNNASGKVGVEVTCTTNSIYVYSVSVTCDGGASYNDYSTACGCWYTGVEQAEEASSATRKIVENGQVLILRDGVKYTLFGQPVK